MTWPQDQPETPAHLRDSDRAAGADIGPDCTRFSQMNDVFTRAFRDDSLRTPTPTASSPLTGWRPHRAGARGFRPAILPCATPPEVA